MFTVIICDRHIIDDCNSNYYIYLKPLLENNNYAFCEWDTSGESLETAVPGLKNAINRHSQWRALIVLDRYTSGYDLITKRNPFDVVNAKKPPASFESCEQIMAFRAEKEAAYNAALGNPLTKLSIWLAGVPQKVRPRLGREYDSLPDLSDPEYFDKLDDMELNPVDVEINLSRLKKFDKISQRFDRDGAIFELPKSIIALCERTTENEFESESDLWKKHTEFDYSRFYDDNLYPDKLRYLLFNIPYIRQERNELVYFNFLTTILALAQNEPPHDAIRPNRVYRIKPDCDNSRISGVCTRYREKLLATRAYILSRINGVRNAEKTVIPSDEAKRIFESEAVVPVEIRNDFDTKQLFCRHDGIGLSKNCPSDEESYWDSQYRGISKLFVRYLREPRRSIKTAVDKPFRENNFIEDERAFSLNEYQRDDIDYKLQDEEQLMVESLPKSLFNNDEYTKQMTDADKELSRKISQRMSKLKTVVIGAIAILAYILGFIPFFVGNHAGRYGVTALIVTAVSVGLFTAVGFICLFILKRILVNRFKHFNYVMSGIIKDIESSLEKYSVYLSHACNVMREFSIKRFLMRTDDEDSRKCKIMKSYVHVIENRVDEITRLFSDYLKEDYDVSAQEPYNYDFTVLADYDFPMPYVETDNRIEFIQPGYSVSLPVDYINSLMLEREELYD